MADWIEPRLIVLLAGGTFILAYLIINQVVLRLFVLIGTALYIWYYFVAADTPLWEAILTSVLMGVANLIGLLSLFARQSRFAIPRAHADIYPRFRDLPPGDFRALMALAERHTVDTRTRITTENGPLTHLTYVISGGMEVHKAGDRFNMPAGLFVGEVAYLMHTSSAASTWLKPGSEVLQWDVATLRKRSGRNDRFKLALEAMISKDLAVKVQVAVAPNTKQWREKA